MRVSANVSGTDKSDHNYSHKSPPTTELLEKQILVGVEAHGNLSGRLLLRLMDWFGLNYSAMT